MAVDVKYDKSFQPGIPHKLFEVPKFVTGSRYVVTSDGQRFLVPISTEQTDTPTMTVVLNWAAALKK